MNKNFLCPKPWTDIIFDQRGKSFCCESSLGHKDEANHYLENNSEQRMLFREAILRNKNQTSCQNCMNFNCSNIYSERDLALQTNTNEVYKTTGFDGKTSQPIENIKINFSSHPGVFRLTQSFLSSKIQNELSLLIEKQPELLLFSNIHYPYVAIDPDHSILLNEVEKHITHIRSITISLNNTQDISTSLLFFKDLSQRESLQNIDLKFESYYALFDESLTELSHIFKSIKYTLQSFGSFEVQAYLLGYDLESLKKNIKENFCNDSDFYFDNQLFITPYLFNLKKDECDFQLQSKNTFYCHHPFDHSKTNLFPTEIQQFLHENYDIINQESTPLEAREFLKFNKVFDEVFQLKSPANLKELYNLCLEVPENPNHTQKVINSFFSAIKDKNLETALLLSKAIDIRNLSVNKLKIAAEFFLSSKELLLSFNYFEVFLSKAKVITYTVKDLAWKLKKSGHHQAALQLHSKILNINPQETDALNSLVSGGFEKLNKEETLFYIQLLDKYEQKDSLGKIQKSLLLKKIGRYEESLNLHLEIIAQNDKEELIRNSLISGGWLELNKDSSIKLELFLEEKTWPSEKLDSYKQLALIHKNHDNIDKAYSYHKKVLETNVAEEALEIIDSLYAGGWDNLNHSHKKDLIKLLKEYAHFAPLRSNILSALYLKDLGNLGESFDLHLKLANKNIELIESSIVCGGWDELDSNRTESLIVLLDNLQPKFPKEVLFQKALLLKKLNQIQESAKLHLDYLETYSGDQIIIESLRAGGWIESKNNQNERLIQFYLNDSENLKSCKAVSFGLKLLGENEKSLKWHLKTYQRFKDQEIKESILGGGWNQQNEELKAQLKKFIEDHFEELSLSQKAVYFKEDNRYDEAISLIRSSNSQDNSLIQLLLLPGWRKLNFENHIWYREFLYKHLKFNEESKVLLEYAKIIREEYNEDEFLKTLILLPDSENKRSFLKTVDWQNMEDESIMVLVNELNNFNDELEFKIILSKIYFKNHDYKNSYINFVSSLSNKTQLENFLSINWIELDATDDKAHLEVIRSLNCPNSEEFRWLYPYSIALAYTYSNLAESKQVLIQLDCDTEVIARTTGLSQAAHLFHKVGLNGTAIKYFSLSDQRKSLDKEDLKLMGWLLKAEKRYPEALKFFQRVLLIDPTDLQALDEVKRLNSSYLNKIKNTLRKFI